MNLDSIRIVLVATSHPGNIGSTARAMKTMGLHRLYLVSPQTEIDYRAHEMAAGADDVYRQAIVTDSLASALEGCRLIFATSARPRDIALEGVTPREGAAIVHQQSDDTEVAFVFGREHAGLTNDELLHCHYHVHIPSNPQYSSLNLAQSVQLIAYELRMASLNPNACTKTRQDDLATSESIEQFYTHLKEVLIEIDFLKPSNPKRLLQRVRRMFNRIQLEKLEINILRGMLTHVQDAIRKRRPHE